MDGRKGGVRRLLDLSGRVALITGGSRGLGLQIASGLGEMGARLVLVSRNGKNLDAAASKLARQRVAATTIACDLLDRIQCAALADEAMRRTGRIDILVNSVGTAIGAPTANYSIPDWNRLIALNLTATFAITRAVARIAMLPARYGRVINLSSVAGFGGRRPRAGGSIAYATTKAGIISFTRALAAQWAPLGVTVNALAPDVFPTDMTRGMIERNEQAILDRIPMGRLGGSEDLKGVAVLLASDASAFVTGQTVAVDGGSTSV